MQWVKAFPDSDFITIHFSCDVFLVLIFTHKWRKRPYSGGICPVPVICGPELKFHFLVAFPFFIWLSCKVFAKRRSVLIELWRIEFAFLRVYEAIWPTRHGDGTSRIGTNSDILCMYRFFMYVFLHLKVVLSLCVLESCCCLRWRYQMRRPLCCWRIWLPFEICRCSYSDARRTRPFWPIDGIAGSSIRLWYLRQWLVFVG